MSPRETRFRDPIPALALAAVLTAGLAIAPAAVAQHEAHAQQAAHQHAGHQGAGHPGTGQASDEHAEHRRMLAGGGEVKAVKLDGLEIPDVPVVTQAGEEVYFFSDLVEGKVVAMNFIFTTCTTICPPLGANFGKLQQLLGERMGRDVHLISVSVDPVTDTPQRLEAWGRVFGAGPGWTLVTGSKPEVTKLLKGLQVFTPDINDHSPTVLVGSAEGTWTRAYGLAPPAELAAMLERVAAGHGGAASAGGAP